MYKFTTPTHVFKFPDDPETYKRIEITYSQRGIIILEKSEENLTFGEDNSAYFTVTQQETSLFHTDVPIELQIRVMTSDNMVLASKKQQIKIYDILNDKPLEV